MSNADNLTALEARAARGLSKYGAAGQEIHTDKGVIGHGMVTVRHTLGEATIYMIDTINGDSYFGADRRAALAFLA
jgi:hypothetical protein